MSADATGGRIYKAPRKFAAQRGDSRVANEAGEALVHMILVVAVEKGRAGIVGDEGAVRGRKARQADRVLDEAGGRLVADLDEFETVAVEMDGMSIAALVVENEPVAPAAFDNEQRARIRPRFSIDRPAIVAAAAAWNLLEFQGDRLVRRRGAAERGVVPRRF